MRCFRCLAFALALLILGSLAPITIPQAFASKRPDCSALLDSFEGRLDADLKIKMNRARGNAKLTIHLLVPKNVEENASSYSDLSTNIPLRARLGLLKIEILSVQPAANGEQSDMTIRGTKKDLTQLFTGFQEREARGYRELQWAGFQVPAALQGSSAKIGQTLAAELEKRKTAKDDSPFDVVLVYDKLPEARAAELQKQIQELGLEFIPLVTYTDSSLALLSITPQNVAKVAALPGMQAIFLNGSLEIPEFLHLGRGVVSKRLPDRPPRRSLR